MGLIEYPDVTQGSTEWHDLRRGMVTASTVGKLITPALKVADNDTSRGLTALLVAERITGHVEDRYYSFDMQRGHEDEPRARDVYSEHYAPVTESGFLVRDDWGFEIGCSPDGLVGDDGMIEIKSQLPKLQLQTLIACVMPSRHMMQCQAALLVSGREWLDLIGYCGGMPMWRERVLPRVAWQNAIIAAVEVFEENAARMTAVYRDVAKHLPTTERPPMEIEMRL